MFTRKHSTGSPNPVMTSSTINSVSVRLHHSRTTRNVLGGQRRIPAAPWISGSITTAATFSGLGWAKRFQRLDTWDLDDRKVPPGRGSLEQRWGTQTRRARRIAMITAPKSDKLMFSRAPHSPILVGNSQSDLDSC